MKRPIDRRSGVALWRQVADRIRLGIAGGSLGADGRLPPEIALAQTFGVNRHTLRTAIASLVDEGVLRAEQGRGTFVESRRRIAYPIAARTRFSTGLRGQAESHTSRLIAHAEEPADSIVSEHLALRLGGAVVRLETVSEADGRPVARATAYFDAARFAGFADAYAETLSITAALARFSVADYLRRSTVVSARHADAQELTDLRLAPGAIVLFAEAVNVDLEGHPIQYSRTRFAADRVELTVVDQN
ncbi:MAG: phosphonate metabolism transcriptional regulator PhnF [Rhizobiaceae bacterium]|nr:phosphonate metabolism transcriptional regulator PhnF [Rhizobiaceae bacterium]